MKRIKKAVLLPIRWMAYQWKLLRLYYWAETELNEMRSVCVMPSLYYCWLYRSCLWLIEFNKFKRLANRAIHTIPYQVRFELA